ncbi:P-loop ATPase, Sll1717 family [Agromyces sp. GXQ0307]|uniref:P-loop ATPase, Sll1717 family n=1 Tax=Agromyces sp. GXQ0307 TaxID=3377835 RepID=UPI00383B25EC
MSVRLVDLDFGDPSAESDERLIEHFIFTPLAEQLATRKIGLVVGRKGSGKTALFRGGEELFKKYNRPANVIRLDMNDLTWGAFADYKNLGLTAEHAATAAWHLALLVQVAAQVVAADYKHWSRESQPDVAVLTTFIRDNFGDITPSLAKSSALIGQISGLKIGAFGASLEASFRGEPSAREIAPALSDAIAQHLIAPMNDSPWIILVDKVDDAWDASQDKKSLIVGLIKAVKRINDDFGWRDEPFRGLRAIAFLRTDIYDVLAFDDKDKHRASTIQISWRHEELREMLQRRLGENLELDDIFETRTQQRGGRIPIGSFNYLVSRTFMRPRDLIQFLSEIQTAAPDAEKIRRGAVQAAEVEYSKNKVDDLLNEYRRAAPWVEDAFNALRFGPTKYGSRSEVLSRLSDIDTAQLQSRGMRGLEELADWMVEESVLGSSLRQGVNAPRQFRCEGAQVQLREDRPAWVHPALVLGLALTEPRAARN